MHILYVHKATETITNYVYFWTTAISEPDDVSVCEGVSPTLTCVLGATGATVEWYRIIKNTGAIQRIRQNTQDITITTSNGNTINSSLTINNAKESHTGYYWVGEETEGICNASVTVLRGMWTNIAVYVATLCTVTMCILYKPSIGKGSI